MPLAWHSWPFHTRLLLCHQKHLLHCFWPFFPLRCYNKVTSKFEFTSEQFFELKLLKWLISIATKKNFCENRRTQITKRNILRLTNKASARSFTCPSGTNSSTKMRAEESYHRDEKPSAATARAAHKCKFYDEDFHSFLILHELKREELRPQRISRTPNVGVTRVVRSVDDNSLK